jgi:DNA-binding MarR family transcriptional regulator
MSSDPSSPCADSPLPLALRGLGEAAGLLEQVFADRLGLNRTDLAVLGLLAARGPLTPGQLAEATGLTTGAVTGVADRLERSGYARREPDPDDRRRVILSLVRERLAPVARLQEGFHAALHAVEADLSEAERAMVAAYVGRATEAFRAEAERLRGPTSESAPPASPTDGELTVPLEGVSRGRLEFSSGVSRLTLASDAPAGLLLLGRFDGRQPKLKVRGGVVSIAYPHFGPFGWRKTAATVALSPSVPWDLELRGGVARLDADLTGLTLGTVELRGGCHQVTLRLPRPVGSVSVRLTGGASEVTLRRPIGSEARLRLTGGAAGLTFDAQRLGAVGGTVVLETPGFGAARDRYELELTGGASGLTVTTP